MLSIVIDKAGTYSDATAWYRVDTSDDVVIKQAGRVTVKRCGELVMRDAVIHGDVDLTDAVVSNNVLCTGARIHGNLLCRDAVIYGRLCCSRVNVVGDLDCSGADIYQTLECYGACIGRELLCRGSSIHDVAIGEPTADEICIARQVVRDIRMDALSLDMLVWHGPEWTPAKSGYCNTTHCLAGAAQCLSADPAVRRLPALAAGKRLLPNLSYLFYVSAEIATLHLSRIVDSDTAARVAVGQRVRLTADIFDDGEDHHPPCYLGCRGDIVIVRKVDQQPRGRCQVSHADVTDGSTFIVHLHEYIIEDDPEDKQSAR